MEVYLDNSATTRSYDCVAEIVAKVMLEDYGNPSSMHMKGVEAERYIRYAKETIAKNLKVSEKEILFTSGGTESDNLALIGTAMANRRAGCHLITTRIEHPAILQTMHYLEGQGFQATYLPVDENGCVRLEDLRRAIRRDTILVSIMHTNNEIGSLQPIEEAGALIKSINPRIIFHVDAVQGYGKFRIYPKKMNIDLLSVSGHKIHGPKGVGFLYINEKIKIQPILFGGGQQKGMRSGTENVAGVAGLAKAVERIYENLEEERDAMYSLKERLIRGVTQLPDVRVNGIPGWDGSASENRDSAFDLRNDASENEETARKIRRSAPHVVSVSFRGIRSEVLLHALEERGIYVSAGSACASNKAPKPSDTLRAIGLEKDLLDSTLRLSLSVFTTQEEIDYTLQTLYDIVPVLRKYTRR
ncbi:MAG: cysteine desulfurase [Lachnospiraceae bacterium]|nr:cysteine desulfurase [Lachnospiraceae bacterium]